MNENGGTADMACWLRRSTSHSTLQAYVRSFNWQLGDSILFHLKGLGKQLVNNDDDRGCRSLLKRRHVVCSEGTPNDLELDKRKWCDWLT